MPNRHKDFNKFVAPEFKDLNSAQTYITNLINNEGLSLEEALRKAMKSMGLQDFSERVGISLSYVSDFVNKRRKWSTDTLLKYLDQVFHLKIKMTVITHKDGEA